MSAGVPARRRPRAVVVGGSLGGLHTALALGDAAWDADVFEQSGGELASRGAGIVVQEESVTYLERHGLARREALSTSARERRYLARDGGVAAGGVMRQRFTAWNALYRAYHAALPAARYHTGAACVGFDQDAGGVDVRFADGRTERADLLVFADGARSTGRRLLLPGVNPVYAGYVAWRGVVPEGDVPGALADAFRDRFTFFQYAGSHILCYLVPGADGELAPGARRLNWVWYVNTPEGPALERVMTDGAGRRRATSVPPGAAASAVAAELHARAVADLPPTFRDLVLATAEPFVQPIVDLAVPRMAFGRVCLLGDAAFVPRPHTAASTSKACADGFALAAALRGQRDDVPRALRAWEGPQLALGRALEAQGRALGDRSQFGELERAR